MLIKIEWNFRLGFGGKCKNAREHKKVILRALNNLKNVIICWLRG